MPTPETTVAKLKPNPRNPRKVTDAKLAMLKKAMERFGDLGGVVLNTTSGHLVGGHQRTKVLPRDAKVHVERRYASPTKAGTVAEGHIDWAGERFAYREVAWPADVEKAANLAANKGAGDFDTSAVAEWLGELDTGAFDMDLTMFDADELAAIMAPETLPVETDGQDDELEPSGHTDVQYGDMYRIGSHVLLCGDSTVITEVERAMEGRRADMVWTDPPYGIAYAGGSKKRVAITNDGKGDLTQFLRDVCAVGLTVTKPGAVWYVAAPPGTPSVAFSVALTEAEIWRHTLAWVKNNSTFGMTDYHYRHEIIYYGWSPGGPHHAVKDRKQDTVWECDRPSKSPEHPTMKPLALIERSLLNSSDTGAIVFEPFGGSGSTLMACEKTSRQCVAVEIDPVYCQVIIDRAERLFGLKAELLSNGMEKVAEDA